MGVEELAISIAEEKLHATVQRAKSLESLDREAAALAYEEASRYATRIASLINIPYNRRQVQERALRYKAHADSLRAPPAPRPAKISRPTNFNERGPEAEDEGKTSEDGKSKHLSIAASFLAKADSSWDDIAGVESTKRLLKGMVFAAVAKPPPGVKIDPPSGILLYGPPGTGKTMLAAAAAGSFGATFLNVPASKLKDKYVGESGKILQAVFDYGVQNAPALIFLDDIDTLVTNRESSQGGGVGRDLIGGLLTAMDGFANKGKSSRPLVLVIANTNQPWILDEALMSRFTQRVHVPLPDESTREQILTKLLPDNGYECHVTMAELAKRTHNFSGRELANFQRAIVGEMIGDMNREMVDRSLTVDEMRNATMKISAIRDEHVDRALEYMKPKTSEETLQRMQAWSQE